MPVRAPNGRMVSCGRLAAIACIDHVLEQEDHIQALYEALRQRFLMDPVSFLEEFVLTTTPQKMMIPEDAKTGLTLVQQIRQATAEMDASVPAPAPLLDPVTSNRIEGALAPND